VDAKTMLQISPKNAAGAELMLELSKLVKEMETGARKLVSDACAPGADRALLRQIIGLVHDDEARGPEVAGRGGAQLLLDCALNRDALAFVVLSRLAGIQGNSAQQVVALINDDVRAKVVAKIFEDKVEDGHAAAALAMLMRCQIQLDKFAEKSKQALPLVDPAPYVRALASNRIKLRETAIESCATIFGSHTKNSKIKRQFPT